MARTTSLRARTFRYRRGWTSGLSGTPKIRPSLEHLWPNTRSNSMRSRTRSDPESTGNGENHLIRHWVRFWLGELFAVTAMRSNPSLEPTRTGVVLGPGLWQWQEPDRDIGRASNAIRNVGEAGWQGLADGGQRAHQERPKAAARALQVTDLGSRDGDACAQAVHHGHRHPGLLL